MKPSQGHLAQPAQKQQSDSTSSSRSAESVNTRRKLFVALGALALTTLLFSLPYLQTLGDDTFIYMRAVVRFLEGNGFEYNLGKPIYIVNSVTWFFSWVLGTYLLGDLDLARYALSILFHVFAFLSLAVLAHHYIRSRIILFLLLVTVFFDPFYLRWFWGGWEVSLKIAMAALTLFMLVRVSSSSNYRAYFAAGIVAGLAFLTRPELLVLVIVGFLFLALKRPPHAKSLALYALGTTMIALPWALFAIAEFGTPISHTVFAKTSDQAWNLTYLSPALLRFGQLMLVPSIGLIALLTIALAQWFRGERARQMLAFPQQILGDTIIQSKALDLGLLLFWVAASLGYLASGAAIISVKILLFSPFFALLVAAIVDQLTRSPNPLTGQYAQRVAFLTTFVIVILSLLVQYRLFLRYSLFNANYRMGEDKRLIDFSKQLNSLTNSGDTIGLTQLGVVSFYAMDRQMIDFQGLGTPEIVPYMSLHGRQDYVSYYLDDLGEYPDYIVQALRNDGDLEHSGQDIRFWRYDYRPILEQEVQRIGGNQEVGDLVYILYKRVSQTDKQNEP